MNDSKDNVDDLATLRNGFAKAKEVWKRGSTYFVHMRVVLKSYHVPTNATRHTVGDWLPDVGLRKGPELPTPHSLAIVQYPNDEGFYLLYLDETGGEITDTYHDSLDLALAQARMEFQVEPEEWQAETSQS